MVVLCGSSTNADVLSKGRPMLLIRSVDDTDVRKVHMFVVSEGP